jgi:hypothetical protein
VDEFYDFAKQHTARVKDRAASDADTTARAQGLSRADRRLAVQTRLDGASKGVRKQVKVKFVQEFGATWQRTPGGGLVKPKGATEGVLHATREDAEAVAARLNQGSTVEFGVMKAGKRYGVVPTFARDRLRHHQKVGSSPALGSAILRTTGRAFRSSVLPISAKWLAGQATEAGVRSVVAGAGPFDLLRFDRVVKRLNRATPGAGDELKMRVTGGQFGLTGTAREFANGKTLADEFAKTSLARPAAAATRVGQARPLKAVRTGWGAYTRVVMDTVNGAFENTARKAMAGQAIREGRLMEDKIIGLSHRAITDAANGLRGTDAQVQLGRAVDRMYGRYQKFSPDRRETMLHTTPFASWYLNCATFIFKTLPVDHPLKTALLADIDALEEDWRKSHGMSLLAPGHKPSFLLGGLPLNDGRVVPIGHYTPLGITDPVQAAGDLVVPQLPALPILKGSVDWKGTPLKHPDGKSFTAAEVAAYALAEQLGVTVPGLDKARRIADFQPAPIRVRAQPKTLGQRLLGEVPFTPSTKPHDSESAATVSGIAPIRVKPIRVPAIKPIRVRPIRVRVP